MPWICTRICTQATAGLSSCVMAIIMCAMLRFSLFLNWKLCASSFLSLLPSTVMQQATSTSSGCWEQMARSGCGSWVKALATSPMKRSPRSWLQREHACKHRGRLRSSGERCWLGGYWVGPEPRALGRSKLWVESRGAGQRLAVLSSVKIN